jgi:hypothetical protein
VTAIIELVDFSAAYSPVDYQPSPVRTATACNALHCTCIEWADGPMIAGYPSCHVCTHTRASHTPHNTYPTKKKAARS